MVRLPPAGVLASCSSASNLISLQALRKAQDAQTKDGGRLGYHLIKTGAIEEQKLTEFLSKQYGVPAINLKDFDIEPDVIKLVPREVAEKHLVVPVNRAGPSLIVAMSDPSNIVALDDLKFLTGYNIEPVVASEVAIKEAIEHYYATKGPSYEDVLGDFEADVVSQTEEQSNVVDLEKAADDAPVVKLVNLILMDAIKKGASDIHVEPYEKDFRVRYRIDGVLYEVMKPPIKLKAAITSRLKIMAELDIAERRLPQDGRIKLRMSAGKEMDFRVSVCPTLFGEKVVLRLLDKSNLQLDMTKLGFEEKQLEWFTEAIERPYGMVLVTGPTGSGKTTTLYSALAKLNLVSDNISTAEDPVEFNFAGINQVQMHEDIGLNFAAALRSFLRQDPDIIMVGEIRDFEDRRDRGQGRPHGPPGAVDLAYQRRPGHREPPAQHGHRAFPGHGFLELDPRPASLPQALPGVQEGEHGRAPGAHRRGGLSRAHRHLHGLRARRLQDLQ